MGVNVAHEVTALKEMTVKELRSRYLRVFGERARSGNKDWLWKRIIWRMQSLEQGDLTERARRRAEELANDADLRVWGIEQLNRSQKGRFPRAVTRQGYADLSPRLLPMSHSISLRRRTPQEHPWHRRHGAGRKARQYIGAPDMTPSVGKGIMQIVGTSIRVA